MRPSQPQLCIVALMKLAEGRDPSLQKASNCINFISEPQAINV